MNFDYYYNNVPEKGMCRNNLIYTSLISKDKKTFCMWFYNDTDYHKGQNQVVNPLLMNEKFKREIEGLTAMSKNGYADLIPEFDIDFKNKKVFLTIDGPDMWELAGCRGTNYSSVIQDWDEQMLNILRAHKSINMYKYSLHPSSYFVVNGRLKSINYFFTYFDNEPYISLKSVMSHISNDRQQDLFTKMERLGIDVNVATPHNSIQILAFESFKTNFDHEVMERAKKIYV
jgi:hypothetical protein